VSLNVFQVYSKSEEPWWAIDTLIELSSVSSEEAAHQALFDALVQSIELGLF
jgi:hypothetical protein